MNLPSLLALLSHPSRHFLKQSWKTSCGSVFKMYHKNVQWMLLVYAIQCTGRLAHTLWFVLSYLIGWISYPATSSSSLMSGWPRKANNLNQFRTSLGKKSATRDTHFQRTSRTASGSGRDSRVGVFDTKEVSWGCQGNVSLTTKTTYVHGVRCQDTWSWVTADLWVQRTCVRWVPEVGEPGELVGTYLYFILQRVETTSKKETTNKLYLGNVNGNCILRTLFYVVNGAWTWLRVEIRSLIMKRIKIQTTNVAMDVDIREYNR